MLISSSSLHIIDNSGGLVANCIAVLNNKRFGSIGDRLVVSVRKVARYGKSRTPKKTSVGKVYRGLVVQTRKERRRFDGSTVKFPQNSIILLNRQDQPIGTRIKSLVPVELKSSPYLKTLSLGANTI